MMLDPNFKRTNNSMHADGRRAVAADAERSAIQWRLPRERGRGTVQEETTNVFNRRECNHG